MADGYVLQLLMGPVIAVPVPQPVADALTSVQVTTTAGQASGFQLTFAVSKRSPITTVMLPAGFFDPGVRVIVLVIVNGTPTVLMDGVITRHDLAPGDEPGASTFTVTGEDLTVVMDIHYKQVCYPGLSAEARVAVICLEYGAYGIIPAPVPTVLLDVPNPVDQIPTQSSTDLAYLQDLADVAGYVFYIEPGPVPGVNIAYWGPEVRIGFPQPALSVNLDAASNVQSLNFSFDGRAKTTYTITIQEPFTKLGIPVPLPDIGLLRPPLGARPSLPMRTRPLEDTANLSPVKAALLGLSRSATASDSISGQGTLDVLRYGHILKARQLVSVRGAGFAYDGLYYVKSVTHDLERGKYTQSFQLGRDGLVSLTSVVPT
jgi:hypothetical protein